MVWACPLVTPCGVGPAALVRSLREALARKGGGGRRPTLRRLESRAEQVSPGGLAGKTHLGNQEASNRRATQ